MLGAIFCPTPTFIVEPFFSDLHIRSRTAVCRSMRTVGVSGWPSACERFLRGFQSIFEPDGQNAQKQGGKFGGSRNKIFKQSI